MSSTIGPPSPGAATAIGLVESSRSIPPQGAMWLALPTARYSPIMSCSSGIAAYSDAGPAWLLRFTPTQATPAVFAFSIAVFAAKLITTCPMPLSPSTSAIPAASRVTRIFGFTLTAPARILRTYCGRRKIPWPSAPWRSARTIRSGQTAASLEGRPTATSASAVKRLRRVAGIRRAEVSAASDFAAVRSGGRDMPHPTMRAKAQQRSGMIRPPSEGAILKKTKILLAVFSAFCCALDGFAQQQEKPDEIRIIGHYENAVGTSDAASQGYITPQLIEARPMQRPGEVLEYVPGVVITQHSGDGKANQYFLRGFNLDHGTDFLTTLDHMPVNMPTHAHGQGYSDLNFLIPELVSRVAYKKGPYFAEEGDFSSAGVADIDYYTKMPKEISSLGLGSNGYQRAMAANSSDSGPGHLLYGFELFHNDGPWVNPEDYRKLNGVLRFSQGTNADGYTVSLIGYHGQWNATDQIPQRAVDDGTISRFGAIDPTDGGRTSRYSLSLDRHKTLANGGVFHMDVYAIKYRLNLFSNFTFFLDHPFPLGDQFEQADNRTIVGVTPSWVFTGKWDERQTTNKIGFDARRDNIDVALYNTAARDRFNTVRSDKVVQTGVGLYYENTLQWTDTFRSIAGVREDFYNARVDSDLAANSGTTSAHIASPKLNFIFGPFDRTEY